MLLTCLITPVLASSVALCKPLEKRLVLQGALGVDTYWNDCDTGSSYYTTYTGNGSIAAGWPSESSWISFQDLWCVNQHVIERSCSSFYNTTDNSAQEMRDLRNAINVVSHETRVDHRFILAAVIQETGGCVRANTVTSSGGIHNKGLLQAFKGINTCNNNGKISIPCPKDQILGMIRDGVDGTDEGHGFAEDISVQSSVSGIEFAQAHYRAARLFISGQVDSSGNLEKSASRHCYASDFANRLTGWVDAASTCTLDN